MFSTPDHGLIVQDHFHKEKADYSKCVQRRLLALLL